MAIKTKVLTEALKLPVKQRAELAQKLLRSLDEGEDPNAAEAWDKELERRAKAVRSGAVKGIPLEDVRRDITERLGRIRVGKP